MATFFHSVRWIVALEHGHVNVSACVCIRAAATKSSHDAKDNKSIRRIVSIWGNRHSCQKRKYAAGNASNRNGKLHRGRE